MELPHAFPWNAEEAPRQLFGIRFPKARIGERRAHQESSESGEEAMKIEIKEFSHRYRVRRVEKRDVPEVYALCRRNSLYYQYCPPAVTEQTIIDDMNALPKNKSFDDKYYVGFFDSNQLIAVMDFVMGYPDEGTGYIGFFMTDASVQGRGIGSAIIDDLCAYLKTLGLSEVRLCWVKGNPQAENFWHRNRFKETGDVCDRERYTVIIGRRAL